MMRQSYLSKPRRMLVLIDEEILDEWGLICASEQIALEDIKRDIELEKDLEKKRKMFFFYKYKKNLYDRMQRSLDHLFVQLGKPTIDKRREEQRFKL